MPAEGSLVHMEGGCVLNRIQLFVTPRAVACQAPLSIEFSKQEYWSELLFPTLGPTWRMIV